MTVSSTTLFPPERRKKSVEVMNRPTRGLRAISYFVPFAFYLELRSIFHPLCVAFESICDQFFPPPHVNYGPNNAHARDSHAKIAVMMETMWSANCNWIMQFNFDNCSPVDKSRQNFNFDFPNDVRHWREFEREGGESSLVWDEDKSSLLAESPLESRRLIFRAPSPRRRESKVKSGLKTPTSHHF